MIRYKEKEINKFLQASLPEEKIVYNRVIAGGLSRRRPDWLIRGTKHNVIIECDESEHYLTEESVEDERNIIMFKDLKKMPLFIIRFNPDYYEGKCCFVIDKKEKSIRATSTWETRSQVLLDTIKHHLANPPDEDIIVTHLFFNKGIKKDNKVSDANEDPIEEESEEKSNQRAFVSELMESGLGVAES